MRRAVIATALPVEYQAVRAHLVDVREETHVDGTVYERGIFRSPEAEWDVLLVETGPHNDIAARETERALAHHRPVVALFVGVAGGLKDVRLGDVVAASAVSGYESGAVETEFKSRRQSAKSGYRVVQRARAARGKANRLAWQDP